MPSNTGLYSDSDNESLSAELSPTDGYFNGRDHPQDVLIPDPSQASSESDKAREAREEAETSRARDASTSPRRDSQYSPRSIPSRARFNPVFEDEGYTETTPLLRSAPPAYSPPASGSTFGTPGSRSSASGNDNRSSIHNMDRPQIFLPTGGPQDLGGDPLLGGSRRKDDDGWMSQWWKRVMNVIRAGTKYIVIAIALIVGLGFILTAVRPTWNHKVSIFPSYLPQHHQLTLVRIQAQNLSRLSPGTISSLVTDLHHVLPESIPAAQALPFQILQISNCYSSSAARPRLEDRHGLRSKLLETSTYGQLRSLTWPSVST